MRRLLSKVHGFWFEEAPAPRVASLRLILGAYTLWHLLARYGLLIDVSQGDSGPFAPVGLATLLSEPITPDDFSWLLNFLLVLNVVFLIGWRHRLTGPLFAALLLFVFSYRNSFGMIYHTDNTLVLHVLVLAVSPAADAYSLDARRRTGRGAAAPAPSWRYGWPIRLMCALVVFPYFLAGIAKVVGPLGFSWAMGSSLRAQVAVDAVRKELLGSQGASLAYTVYDQVWLFTTMGFGTLILELGAPLVLLNRRVSWLWAVSTFFMHIGILAIMGIRFHYQLWGVAFLCFFPMERLWGLPGLVRARWRRRQEDSGEDATEDAQADVEPACDPPPTDPQESA